MTNKFFFVLCNLAISCTMLQAQTLTFSNAAPNNSPQHLIQNVFVGNTITTLNHQFNGIAGNTTSSQVGFFSNGASTIGLDSGIVLTSGRIQTIAQNGFSSFNNFGPGDPDLLTISSSVPANTCPPTSTNDRAILEFDFVATTTDTITFDYVFASEEWPNFVCTVFNDVFAFLVSGPGINGPYSNNAINVAIVPGDTLPVSISSIHNGTAGCFTANCFGNPLNNAFYLSVTGPAFTFNAPNAKTTVLTTLAFPVNACDTYNVRLAIADGTDRIYDSAVFLEAGSFTGSGIVVTPAPSFDPFGSDTNFFEQCGVVDIIFVRTDTTGLFPAQCIDIDVAGSATPGVDYTPALPDSVCFQLGDDSAVVSFNPVGDGLPEQTERIVLIVDDPNVLLSCNADSLVFTISDPIDIIDSTFGDTTINCTNDSVWIGTAILDGLPPLTYLWNTGQTDSAFFVKPATTTDYIVTITDACGASTLVDTVRVWVSTPPFDVSIVGCDVTINCTDDSVNLAVVVDSNWYPGMQYTWSTGQTDSTINVFPLDTTVYSVTVSLPCAGQIEVLTCAINVFNDPVILSAQDVPETAFTCPGDQVSMLVNITGGYPPYHVQWSSGGTAPLEFVAPFVTDSFTVAVTDSCQLDTVITSVKVNVPVPDPFTVFTVFDDTLNCPQDFVQFGPPIAGGGFGTGYEFTWNNWADKNPVIVDEPLETTTYTLQVTDACKFDTGSFNFTAVVLEHNPLQLIMPADPTVCVGHSVDLVPIARDGGGKYSFLWNSSVRDSIFTVAPQKTTTYELRLIDDCDTNRRRAVTVYVEDIQGDFKWEYVNDYEANFFPFSRDSVVNYLWDFGDGNISATKDAIHFYEDGREYRVQLIIEDAYGCTDTIVKRIQPELAFWIPTGFTPNADGLNDVFEIPNLAVYDFEIRIFNRWGNLVFESKDPHFQWDGTYNGEPVPLGVYVYKIYVEGDDEQIIERTGTISVLNDFRQR